MGIHLKVENVWLFKDFPNIYTVINEDRNIYILRIVSATCIVLIASYRIQICMLNILKVLVDVFFICILCWLIIIKTEILEATIEIWNELV